MQNKNALSLLKDGELCKVVTAGITREAYWRVSTNMFIFTDRAEPSYIRADLVDEWMPASVRF